MRITLLGTGTSQGVPVIACDCEVCMSEDPRDKRLRSSALLESNGKTIVIDSGPDFRMQLLRAGTKSLDGIVLTHMHKDHIGGLDDVRAFNYLQQRAMDVYADTLTTEQLHREYPYAFAEVRYPGVPELLVHIVGTEPFSVAGFEFIPLQVFHHRLPVLAFRIGDFAYVTDANFIPPESMEKLYGLDVLVLNALRIQKHIAHFNLEEAVELTLQLKPRKAFFTHISHLMGKHEVVSAKLPDNIHLGFDGLQIECGSN